MYFVGVMQLVLNTYFNKEVSMALKVFNTKCTHCEHKAEVFFNDGVGKCEKCGSENLIKLPTTTRIRTETSPNR